MYKISVEKSIALLGIIIDNEESLSASESISILMVEWDNNGIFPIDTKHGLCINACLDLESPIFEQFAKEEFGTEIYPNPYRKAVVSWWNSTNRPMNERNMKYFIGGYDEYMSEYKSLYYSGIRFEAAEYIRDYLKTWLEENQ